MAPDSWKTALPGIIGYYALGFLILANMAGVAAGIYTYWPQLAKESPLLWIFIPDCPLYVFLACLVLLKIVQGRTLVFVTAVGLAKYGLWTLFVLFYYPNYIASLEGQILIVEHIGMTAELALLAVVGGVAAKLERKDLVIAAAWFLLNDALDYILDIHPYLPGQDITLVMVFALLCTIAIPPAIYLAWPGLAKNRFIIKVGKVLRLRN